MSLTVPVPLKRSPVRRLTGSEKPPPAGSCTFWVRFMITTPTGDFRPVLRTVIFENRTGIAIVPPDAPYGEPDTTPRSCGDWALAMDGTAANATMATTTVARRVRVNIDASEGLGNLRVASGCPLA